MAATVWCTNVPGAFRRGDAYALRAQCMQGVATLYERDRYVYSRAHVQGGSGAKLKASNHLRWGTAAYDSRKGLTLSGTLEPAGGTLTGVLAMLGLLALTGVVAVTLGPKH